MPIEAKDLQIDLFNKVDEYIKDIGRMHLQVGWFESAKYDDSTPVASVADQNEHGNSAKNIPPRPFIRPTIEARARHWKSFITRNTKKIIVGDLTGEQMMEALGLAISGDIRKSITEVHEPTLSERTLNQRYKIRGVKADDASDELKKPLVFEAIMLNAVSYVVNEGDEVSPYVGSGGESR